MGEMKPWQWVVVVAAVLMIGYTAFSFLTGSRIPNPNSITVADIETGEMFTIDTSGRKLAILPATNPETGKRTLFPVRQDENGQWVVTPLMAGTLADYEGEAAALESATTMVVRVAEGSPRRLD